MSDPSTPLLRIRGLAKSYGKVRAVRDASLTVHPGQIYALLGRNGAGKTTALRMVLGLVRPHDGELELFGKPLSQGRGSSLARIGAMVEAPSAYPHLSGRQNLEITRRMRGLERPSVQEALDLVELTEAADRKVKGYSLGMKGRLGLASALLGSPDLVILDEPLNGLDPGGIREVRDLIRKMPERGVTVVLSSHQLGEVEQVATHVGILHEGISRFEGPLEQLREAARPSLRIHAEPAAQALDLVRGLNEEASIDRDGTLVIHEPTTPSAQINRQLVEAGIDVHRLEPFGASLEDLFLQLTDDEPAQIEQEVA